MSTEAAQVLDSQNSPINPDVNLGVNTDVSPTLKEDPKISSKLEILIRREQDAMARERAARERESGLTEKLQRIQAFEQARTNPKEALKMLGLSYDELTQAQLQDGEVPPSVLIKQLKEELEHFKGQQKTKEDQELEDKKREAEERERRATEGFKEHIGQYIKDNKSRYELIDYESANELVFDVVDEHYKRTMDETTGIGKVMQINEACDKVEGYLEKKYADSKSLSKVQTLWGAVPKNTQEQLIRQTKQSSEPPSHKPRTLTNQLSAAPQVKPVRLPEDQRIAQIVQQYRASKGL